jgi:peroxiredoxin
MRRSLPITMMVLAWAVSACSDERPAEVVPEPSPATAPNVETTPAATAPTTPAPATAPAGGETLTAAVGRPAPDFTLADQAGTQHRLSQYRGKIVVLEWVNPGCPYVQRHYQARTMRELVEAFPGDRVQWLAIDSSHFVQPADSEAWRREHGLPYPILQDASGDVGRRYEARTTPHMFVIDGQGTLRYAGAIDDDPRGRNAQRTNHVRTAVQALLDGRDPPLSTSEPYGCTVKYES